MIKKWWNYYNPSMYPFYQLRTPIAILLDTGMSIRADMSFVKILWSFQMHSSTLVSKVAIKLHARLALSFWFLITYMTASIALDPSAYQTEDLILF
jgi:hypothetical protein